MESRFKLDHCKGKQNLLKTHHFESPRSTHIVTQAPSKYISIVNYKNIFTSKRISMLTSKMRNSCIRRNFDEKSCSLRIFYCRSLTLKHRLLVLFSTLIMRMKIEIEREREGGKRERAIE